MDEISYSSTPAPKRRISKRTGLFGLVGLVILLLVLGLIFFVTRKGSSPDETSISLPPTTEPLITEAPTSEESLTPTVSKAPSKTPTKAPTGASNDNSDISITVQNGSGESGAANKAADALKAAGYTIASTGNADNFDYQNVTIQVKSSEKAALSGIESTLKSAGYTIGDTSSDLSEGQSYDALVIVGK